MDERDKFEIVGLCWCDEDMSLRRLKWEGHSAECTRARRAWELNRQHMRMLDDQRREDERVGRELRLSQEPHHAP